MRLKLTFEAVMSFFGKLSEKYQSESVYVFHNFKFSILFQRNLF